MTTFPPLPNRASRPLVEERIRGVLAAVPNRATGGSYATARVVVQYSPPERESVVVEFDALTSTRVGIDGLAGTGEPVLVGYHTRGHLVVLPIRWIRSIDEEDRS